MGPKEKTPEEKRAEMLASPKLLWDEYFDGKEVAIQKFAPVIEEEYNKGQPLKKKHEEAMVKLLDVDADSNITFIAWKKFHTAFTTFSNHDYEVGLSSYLKEQAQRLKQEKKQRLLKQMEEIDDSDDDGD